MPELNGHDLAVRLLGARPTLKVMHMSGFPGASARDVARDTPFLQKPFSPEELLRAVRATLDRA